MSSDPALSVVVALISGKTSDLERCLRALARQTILPAEVIVPYDEPCAEASTLTASFPATRLIRAEGLDTWQARSGFRREHHNVLRGIGLRAASGGIVALTEDHAIVADTWCEELLGSLKHQSSAAAVGGPVDCRSDRLLNWAVWFCDFGRYQSPMPEGRLTFMSDSNVAYRREALERVSAFSGDAYDEVMVHSGLSAKGMDLCAAPRAQVWQARTSLTWSGAARERFAWGRSFAGTRARSLPASRRAVLAVLWPLLPLLMTWRLVTLTARRRRHLRQLAKTFPFVVVLNGIWALGEGVGYLTARPE